MLLTLNMFDFIYTRSFLIHSRTASPAMYSRSVASCPRPVGENRPPLVPPATCVASSSQKQGSITTPLFTSRGVSSRAPLPASAQLRPDTSGLVLRRPSTGVASSSKGLLSRFVAPTNTKELTNSNLDALTNEKLRDIKTNELRSAARSISTVPGASSVASAATSADSASVLRACHISKASRSSVPVTNAVATTGVPATPVASAAPAAAPTVAATAAPAASEENDGAAPPVVHTRARAGSKRRSHETFVAEPDAATAAGAAARDDDNDADADAASAVISPRPKRTSLAPPAAAAAAAAAALASPPEAVAVAPRRSARRQSVSTDCDRSAMDASALLARGKP